MTAAISIVTPTLDRPEEVGELLLDLTAQSLLPSSIHLVDASPDRATAQVVEQLREGLPFTVDYLRATGGTAIQRNLGIERATGDYIAFIDDDIRLDREFFATVLAAFEADAEHRVGAVTGYVTNQFLDPETSPRWRWYRRLRLFSTYEPGRWDRATGYPINRYLQPPHESLREIDFLGTCCAVWRREVFDRGLRFDEFFRDYGVLEDAHLALRAGAEWKLLEHGAARCVHLRSPRGRTGSRQIGRKSALNYRYVFLDIERERSLRQEIGFWRVQAIDLLRMLAWAIRHPDRESWAMVRGKIEGILEAARLEAPER